MVRAISEQTATHGAATVRIDPRRWTARCLAVGLLAMGLVAPGLAQPVPQGDDFQVNTYTTDEQGRPDVAAVGADFLVVWDSLGSTGNDTFQRSIQSRRFDAQGTPLAGELQVNTETNRSEFGPRADGLADGRFVVQWNSQFQSTYDLVSALRGRSFDTTGQPVDDDFTVAVGINAYDTIIDHAVLQNTAGEFVTVYSRLYNDYQFTFDSQVESRRFDGDGTLLSGDLVDSTFNRTQYPNASRADDGTFLAVWNDTGFSEDTEVAAHKLDALGAPEEGELLVAEGFGNSSAIGVDVAHDATGQFVVVWSAVDTYYGIDHEVLFRKFDASGASLGPATQLNSFTTASQVAPRIAPAGDGRFLVVWESLGSPDSDQDGTSIRGRLLGADGQPEGEELQINTTTTGDQRFPEIVASHDRQSLLVVWQSDSSTGNDTSDASIQARRFAVSGLFADGFESGDLSRWTSSTQR